MGYVVKTTEGHVTNIGHICGGKYFGVTFKEMSNRFRRDVKEYENREALREFTTKIPSLEQEIESIRNTGWGIASYHRLKKQILSKQVMPAVLVDKLNSMIKNRTNRISIEVSLTHEEREIIAASGATPPAFKIEEVGAIAGISVLYEENDLRELLTIQVEQELKYFQSMDIDSMSFNELRKWVKWVGELKHTLNHVQSLMEESIRFFTPNNLKSLRTILAKRDDKHRFNEYLNLLKFEG